MKRLLVVGTSALCLLASNAQAASPFVPWVLAKVDANESTGTFDYWWKLINVWNDGVSPQPTPQTLENTKLTSFSVSVASGAEIDNIVSPFGWTAAVLDSDISGGQVGRERTVVWTATQAAYALQQEGIVCSSRDPYCHYPPGAVFGLTSNFAPANSKYLTSTVEGEVIIGRQQIAIPAVPEPSTYALLLAAIPVVAFATRRRK